MFAAISGSGLFAAEALGAPDTLSETMGRAAELVAEGRPEDARLVLKRLVEAHPRYGPARLELGRLAVERGSWEEALEQLEIAVEAPLRRQFLAWHLLGRARLGLGDGAAASRAFDEALARADRFAPALVGRAGAAFLLGRFEAAEVDARRASALGGARGPAETLLATILAVTDREPEAGAVLSELADPWVVLDSFRRLLEWLPAEPRVDSLAARWALGAGAFGAAECFAARALRTLASAERDESAPEVYEVMARAQLALGREAEALDSARRAVEQDPGRPRALAALGRAALENLRIEEAVAAYRRALEMDAGVIDEISTTGLAALAEGLNAEARQSLEEHLQKDPDCRSALYLLGRMAQRDQRLEDAIDAFERLAAVEDGSGTRYVLAGLFRRLGDEDRSRAEMKAFQERQRQEEAEWLRQNDAFRRRLEAQESSATQPHEALRIYRALAADDLATADDYVLAGRILIALGKPRDAREWFEQVLAQEPFRKDALEALARSFEAEPESDRARKIRDRLELLTWPCERGTGSTQSPD